MKEIDFIDPRIILAIVATIIFSITFIGFIIKLFKDLKKENRRKRRK